MTLLRPITCGELNSSPRRGPVDDSTLAVAAAIVEDVRARGAAAVREHAERLGDRAPGEPLVLEASALHSALSQVPNEVRALLERTAERIRTFATAQRACLLPLETRVPGGRAGHRWVPVTAAGAYAPGGRYPMPSSVLMTVLPARIAGVRTIALASPRPATITLAAAAIVGVDAVLAVGGAQAIAALAFGTFGTPADVVVGPGNRWVTAAKKHLVGEVGIDGLAGPSELVVLADDSANPATVAADLLGQAEHDLDAIAVLITPSAALAAAVEGELVTQLASLSTAATARQALANNGRVLLVRDLDEAITAANQLAPEHLELCVAQPRALHDRLTAYGSVFLGSDSAEVFGDYGAGPNHVLPTSGGARFQAGLSVATFLRALTFLELDDPRPLAADAASFARLEGLTAHAHSAEARLLG